MTDVAIVGAGYVGLPLAQVFAEAGRSVVLVGVSQPRVDQILRGESYIEDVPSERLKQLVADGLTATTDYDVLRDVDAILIALPTPPPGRARPHPRASASATCGSSPAGWSRSRRGGAKVTSSCSSRRRIRARRANRCSR